MKRVRIWRFCCLYFLVFGLNTEIYRVNLRFQSKCGKIRTRKNFIWLLNSSREFRFFYLFGIFFHRRLLLKHSARVPYRHLLSCQVASTNNYHKGCTYSSLSRKTSILFVSWCNVPICKLQRAICLYYLHQ